MVYTYLGMARKHLQASLSAEAVTVAENSDIQVMVEAELRRRRAIRRMRSLREELQKSNRKGFNQQAVGDRMGLLNGQPTIARLESGTGDPTLSTLERYAAALGGYVDLCIVDARGHRMTEPASVEQPGDDAPIDSEGDLDAHDRPFELADDLKQKFQAATG
jgi:transcriptional regulator with XRE-family HTH domain